MKPLVPTQEGVDPRRWSAVWWTADVRIICNRCGSRIGWGTAAKPCAAHPDRCPEEGAGLLRGCWPDKDAAWVLSAGTDTAWVVLGRSDTPPMIPMTCPTDGVVWVPSSELARMVGARTAELPYGMTKQTQTFRVSPNAPC